MEIKDKFLKVLEKRLNPSQKQLFNLIKVETRKDTLVFRMPNGFISLEGVWQEIQETSAVTKIPITKADVFATLDELDGILGNIQWLWEGWIPRGFVTMAAGDPGVGKSAIVQHLCKIVTEGLAFPLCETPLGEPGNVVWIDTESAQQILKVRSDTMQMDKKRIFIPSLHGDLLVNLNLGIESNREEIINLIEGVEPSLVVIDSLGSSHSKGENKVEEMRPLMEFLTTTARDYQIAILVIHHLNKDRKDEAPEITLSRVRGSTVIPANCRSIFAVERSAKNIRLNMIKSNLSIIGDPITAIPLLNKEKQFTGFEYEPYIPPPTKRSRKELCAEWILETLQQSKDGVALTELIELGTKPGFTRSNIYSARELLGDQVMYSGTGNKAFWSVAKQDQSSIEKIMSSTNGKVKHVKKK